MCIKFIRVRRLLTPPSVLIATGIALAANQSSELADHAARAQAAIASNNSTVAKQELHAMLKIDPANVNALANLGMIEFVGANYSEAANHFTAVLSRSPSLPSAQAFLGMCDLRLGRVDKGRDLLESSYSKVPDRTLHIQAGLELVRSYWDSGEFEKARGVLKKLEEFDATNSEVLYTSYRLHSEIASAALRKLVVADADSAWVHEVLGQNYMAQEHYSPAITEFREAIKRGPRLSGLHYQLGEALFAAARTEENRSLAEKEFLAELHVNPSDAGSLAKLAEIALERSDTPKAKALLKQALAAKSGLADVHVTMAKVLQREGDTAGTIAELEAAEKIAPENKNTHYQLAQLYRAQGKSDEAERELAIFRRLSSAPPKLALDAE
jgi:tetratricopeptide (TPR) repeat protein